MILDEFSYATESDPSLPSNLQAAWDHVFRRRGISVVLSGSHIGVMTGLAAYHAPLYGRFTMLLGECKWGAGRNVAEKCLSAGGWLTISTPVRRSRRSWTSTTASTT